MLEKHSTESGQVQVFSCIKTGLVQVFFLLDISTDVIAIRISVLSSCSLWKMLFVYILFLKLI